VPSFNTADTTRRFVHYRRKPRYRSTRPTQDGDISNRSSLPDTVGLRLPSESQPCSNQICRSMTTPKQIAAKSIRRSRWSQLRGPLGHARLLGKERQGWWGRVRGLDGRQVWIRAADLRPAKEGGP
jgi:hypothetical protein